VVKRLKWRFTMKKRVFAGTISLLLIVGMGLMSCGDNSTGDPSSPAGVGVQAIAVTPASLTVGKGATQQFTATATYDNNSSGVVTPTWSVTATSGNKHANTVISASGLLTIAGLETAPGLIVTATYGGKTGTATVTPGTAVAVTSVEIYPDNITLGAGSKKFIATVSPSAAPQGVTWSLPTPVTGVTLSNEGLLTIPAGLETGATFTIRATSTVNTDRLIQKTITFTNNYAPGLLIIGKYSTAAPADVDIHYNLGAGGLGAQTINRVRVGPNNSQLGSSEYTLDAAAKILTIKQTALSAVVAGSTTIAFDVQFNDASQTVLNDSISVTTVAAPTPPFTTAGSGPGPGPGPGPGSLSAPTGLTATATSSSSIDLSWNSVSGAADYRLYDSVSLTGTYSPFALTGGLATYTDSGLSPGVTYYYKVAALDSSGNEGPQSNAQSATTQSGGPGPGPGPSPGSGIDLMNNQWHSDSFVSPSETHTYQFYANTGTTYFIQWDDNYEGTDDYTGDVRVSASGAGISSFTEDSAYYDPIMVTAWSSGYITITVEPYYNLGTYSIRYYE
jgi:hypothetical protein